MNYVFRRTKHPWNAMSSPIKNASQSYGVEIRWVEMAMSGKLSTRKKRNKPNKSITHFQVFIIDFAFENVRLPVPNETNEQSFVSIMNHVWLLFCTEKLWRSCYIYVTSCSLQWIKLVKWICHRNRSVDFLLDFLLDFIFIFTFNFCSIKTMPSTVYRLRITSDELLSKIPTKHENLTTAMQMMVTPIYFRV